VIAAGIRFLKIAVATSACWKEAISTPDRTEAAESAWGPIVATKLHVPQLPAGRASRPSLVAELRESSGTRLVLVSAPAGAGKTTVLASWRADPAEQRPFAWLALDNRDNDPVRFWGYVLAALRTVAPGLGAGVDDALRSAGEDLTELALPLLVNALASLTEPIVLVLDDYHVISNADVHQSAEFLIDHLPRTVQVAVAGRIDPPLALARLRANAELLEVRAADLRLSADEAAALLNGSLRLDLTPGQVRVLQERTEGWAAGLQLVGLSLRGRGDRERYIASFAGDDRQIVDYLMAEVLERQSPQTREFLLRTSIVARLTGPLCDALLDRGGSGNSARRLVELERANLFVVPLDECRQWYRYHQLFGRLLAHELSLALPDEVVPLHRRARDWHLREGLVAEAIAHAIAAGDHGEAAGLIAASWLDFVNRGELATVEAWTRALPATVAESDPRLCLARAWMLLVLGRPAEVEAEVRAAGHGTLPGPLADGSSSVESSAALVRTSARVLLGDVGAAAKSAALAASLEPGTAAPWRPHVTNALGMTAFWSGAFDEAEAAFAETVSAGESAGYYGAEIYALGYLAVMSAERAEAAEAGRLVSAARALAERQALGEHWVTVMVDYAAGELARARGELQAARARIEHGLNIARRGGLRLDTIYGLLALARIASEAGAAAGARELSARARRQLAACPDPGFLRGWASGVDAAAPESGPAAADSADELSERELTVLRLLSSRLSLREIGDELYVSLNTIKTHTRNIYAKLRVSSREQAVAKARELGLLRQAKLARRRAPDDLCGGCCDLYRNLIPAPAFPAASSRTWSRAGSGPGSRSRRPCHGYAGESAKASCSAEVPPWARLPSGEITRVNGRAGDDGSPAQVAQCSHASPLRPSVLAGPPVPNSDRSLR
jgi:LuxR family maltose regulon positive regulatory protein